MDTYLMYHREVSGTTVPFVNIEVRLVEGTFNKAKQAFSVFVAGCPNSNFEFLSQLFYIKKKKKKAMKTYHA